MFDVKYKEHVTKTSAVQCLHFTITFSKAVFNHPDVMPWLRKNLDEYVVSGEDDTLVAENYVADNAVTRALLAALQNPESVNSGYSVHAQYMLKLLHNLCSLWD